MTSTIFLKLQFNKITCSNKILRLLDNLLPSVSANTIKLKNYCNYSKKHNNLISFQNLPVPYTNLVGLHSFSYSTESKPKSKNVSKFSDSLLNKNVTSLSTPTVLDEKENLKAENEVLKTQKLGLFKKFKLMYKQYWYVLIPVHVITSIGWFGGFYYLSVSGVDIPSLLQTLHISESIIEKLKGSQMGHIAVAYLCYKIATPVRYAVTVGGTTISIKYLEQHGYIKPMPTKTELIKMYEEKKAKRKQEKEEKETKNE